jgi:SAM-dependent methyltransferase
VICHSFLSRFVHPDDTVLDIACGYGEFLNNIRAATRIGVDINPDSRKHLSSGIQFNLADATTFVYPSGADVVFVSNFLEHLPHKASLEGLLDNLRLSLKPGGSLIILGPNLRYLPGKYWDYYDHHLGLTHFSLIEVLQLKGFSIELCLDKFLPYTTNSALPSHPFFVWTYLKIPLSWKVFGKQFFIVAKLCD